MEIKYFKNIKYNKVITLLEDEFKKFSEEEIEIKKIYDLILPYKKTIFEYFKNYFDFVYNYEIGQINVSEDFGKFLEETIRNNKLNVIEFGTWNGLGSTKIIFQNSQKSDSIEINPFINGIAIKNLIPTSRHHRLLAGRIIDLDITKINLKESFLSFEFNQKRNKIDMWLGHLIHLIFTCESQSILSYLNNNYDLLLIDGGGLTTYDEFLIIYPRINKYIFLDDLDGIKGKKIYDFLLSKKDFKLIFKASKRQSCVFEKI